MCNQNCNQGRTCDCAALQNIVQTTRDAGCCPFDPLPDDRPSGCERVAYWACVGLGVGFAGALVFLAPFAWVFTKLGAV